MHSKRLRSVLLIVYLALFDGKMPWAKGTPLYSEMRETGRTSSLRARLLEAMTGLSENHVPLYILRAFIYTEGIS